MRAGLDLAIECAHAGLVERPRESRQRLVNPGMALKRLFPHDRRRLIGRKVAPVVGQHYEIQRVDPPVRRVGHRDIDLALDEGPVHEPQVELANPAEVEPVRLPEPRIAVLAGHELRTESGRHPPGRRSQIRDRPETERLGVGSPDDEGEGVLEAERRTPREPPSLGVGGLHLAERPVGVLDRRPLQDRGQGRPGVLGVEVDLPAHEGVVADERSPEVKAPFHGDPARLELLRQDLPQDVLLGEVLRADHDRVARSAGEEEGEDENGRRLHAGLPSTRRSACPAGVTRRSSSPRSASADSASRAAGRAPARITVSFTIASP